VGNTVPPEPAVAQVKTFGPAIGREQRIHTSIIVPFYGDAFYLLDHVMAQSRTPAGVEWIFVCDDPRLAAGMIEALTNHQRAIRQPTHLVLLEANGGFAHANNIGAKHARGDHLLLMNSDIYCDDFLFLNAGCDALQSKAGIGCIGFSLQFEDGTIQHDGMTFRRSALLNGLWACEHQNKGMPQSWSGSSLEEADAVTAALLLVRRADFANHHIFDPTYLIGDFEDADLCMRLKANGKSIALLRTPGLFHLERQSMRHTGNDEARIAVTHLNCATFNERWGKELGASAERVAS
jgi:GT2 family glycosyltransferase